MHSSIKLGRFSKGRRVFVGQVSGNHVTETTGSSMMDVIENGARPTKATHNLSGLKLLAPIDKPSKIICIGLNYRSHIMEMRWETPKVPVIFSKPPSALIGPDDSIIIPRASNRVDYEGESAIIIGKRAHRAKNGLKHVFGYTCLNDVTARDLQKNDVDWTRAKGFDTFAPIGPFISRTPPTRVTTRLNGNVVQDSPLSDRVFGDAALVEYISTIMTLEPGDVIATGTPSGISPMKDGDVVEIELDSVGCLRNQVVKSP
jgi:2-keto-4-pentenoate hydratase/2-oxohepta-3-ene-1,7-dioic acid hydratase in catechol pathway